MDDVKRLTGKRALSHLSSRLKKKKKKKKQYLYESVTGKQHHPDLFSRFIAICAVTTNAYSRNRR